MNGEAYPQWKRTSDISIALALLVLLFPLILMVACWIRLVSNGPILYRQERVGYKTRRFTLFKFRSLRIDSNTSVHDHHVHKIMQNKLPMTKLDYLGDNRMLPGGKLIRATCVDEIPQLINVLRGEMSLVGPRPCTVNEYNHYAMRDKKRFSAMPGLTGLWQVSGKNKTTFKQMIDMDIEYLEKISAWLDVKIMLGTIPAIMSEIRIHCLNALNEKK